jgi:NAD(P)-dependent dehydrogenase (short-subunit alcohol dehydrogenase family)
MAFTVCLSSGPGPRELTHTAAGEGEEAMTYAIDLSGRRALVTGAGRHTGREFARALAAAGAEVGVNDFKADLAEAVTDEIRDAGGAATAFPFDVTDLAAVSDAVRGFAPDILVNNVGGTDVLVAGMPNFDDTDPASWHHLIDVNVFGLFHCVHAALPAMRQRQWGRIVTIISDASRRGERGMAVYAAAKAASAGFMRAIAAEGGRDGITANCIAFGTIQYAHHPTMSEEDSRRYFRNYFVKRAGRPTDPVGLVLLLSSDHSAWITGQVIPVNGGYTHAL